MTSWQQYAPDYHILQDATKGFDTSKPILHIASSWSTAPTFKSDERVLSVVQLQQIGAESRAVCSGYKADGIDLPAPWLGADPGLAAKYALLEASTTAVQTALAAEAIGIGLKSGLDARILYNAIAGAAGSSWSFRQHGEQMLGLGGEQDGQSFQEAASALNAALATAETTKFYAPLFTLAKQIYTVSASEKRTSSAEVSQAWAPTPRYMNGVASFADVVRVKPSKVGFVGLGAMGMGMAKVLHSAGLAVAGYDVWRPSLERYAAGGGVVAEDMASCATNAEVLLLMVINAQQAEDVLFTRGALEALPQNAAVLTMCTVSPSQAVALAAKVKAARPDVTLVDAPVSGGTPRAASGDLTILASGLGEKNGKALYVLDKLSATQGNTENLFIIPGGAGMGAAVKLVNQHLAGSHIACVAETLAFAARLGLPLRQTRELILSGPAQTWMMGHRGKHMLDGLIQPPTSTIDIFVKDTSIVANESRRLGCPAPLINSVQQQFIYASAHGWGLDDDSSLVRLWKPSGVDVVCPA